MDVHKIIFKAAMLWEKLFPSEVKIEHFLKQGAWDTVSTGLLIEHEILSALVRRDITFIDTDNIGPRTLSVCLGDTKIYLGFLEDRHDIEYSPRNYIRFVLWIMQTSFLIDEIPWMPDHYRIRLAGRLALRFPYVLRLMSMTSIMTHKKHHVAIGSKILLLGTLSWSIRVVILVIAAHYLVPIWGAITWYMTTYM